MKVYNEDIKNRMDEMAQEEVSYYLNENKDAAKCLAAIISLISSGSDEVDFDDWECQLGSILRFPVIE